MARKQLTVKQLVEKLQELELPNNPVVVEIGDRDGHYGVAVSVRLVGDYEVLIERG